MFREHPEYFGGKAPRRVKNRQRARRKLIAEKNKATTAVKGTGRVRVITEWREE
jgi:hypothetical protein